jgi:2-amino-4-hydroxy-6-hydroxymethyldihydropteridine diphosphokinase
MIEDRLFAVVALGSNLGDSERILRSAMDRLEDLSVTPLLRSSLWRSTPVECPPGSPDFVNAVVVIQPLPTETPETLLDRLLALEREFGRAPRQVVNEPRPLDLDLISFGQETRDGPTLVLPHPRAHLRRFVLQPLAEIAPDWRPPGQCKTVASLLEALGESETLERIH